MPSSLVREFLGYKYLLWNSRCRTSLHNTNEGPTAGLQSVSCAAETRLACVHRKMAFANTIVAAD
jgi:hypothetical protein